MYTRTTHYYTVVSQVYRVYYHPTYTSPRYNYQTYYNKYYYYVPYVYHYLIYGIRQYYHYGYYVYGRYALYRYKYAISYYSYQIPTFIDSGYTNPSHYVAPVYSSYGYYTLYYYYRSYINSSPPVYSARSQIAYYTDLSYNYFYYRRG